MAVQRVIRVGTRAAAITIAVKINQYRGVPRCKCPEHGGGVICSHPNPPPCTCTDATGSGVDRACPWATRTWVRIRKHPTLSRWIILIDAWSRPALNATELAAEEDYDPVYDTAAEEDAA